MLFNRTAKRTTKYISVEFILGTPIIVTNAIKYRAIISI